MDFKIKLIHPPSIYKKSLINNLYSDFQTMICYLPYGLGVLASFLRNNGYSVELQDLNVIFTRKFIFCKSGLIIPQKDIEAFLSTHNYKPKQVVYFLDKIIDSISPQRFHLIGFSLLTFGNFLFSLLLSNRLKQRYNTTIVLGGAFISLYGDLYPEIFNSVDYMIRGDGGVPLLKLIDYLKGKIPLSEVPNLTYKKDGKIISNPQQYYPLEDMPVPDFRGLPLELYKNFGIIKPLLPYQIMRGCTNRCSFCVNPLIDSKIEFKSYKKVISDLLWMKERYHSNFFDFTPASTIDLSYEYLDGLCELFVKENLNIRWRAYARVENLDKNLLKKMYQAGCRYLIFGVESGSDKILKMMNKRFSAEEASKTLKASYETGIKNQVNFIIGHPQETKEDVNKTLVFIKKNKRYIYISHLWKFTLDYNTLIHINYQHYGIKRLIPSERRFTFDFEESNGIPIQEQQRQREENYNRVISFYRKVIFPTSIIKRIYNLLFPTSIIKRIYNLLLET